MGSNAFQFAKEDLCCPVCKNPLSSPGSPPKQKITKQKVGRGKGCAPYHHSNLQASKNARIAVSKFKDHEDIVLARCGHLFHKFCLRHYCYLFREGRPNPTCRVTCPLCHEHISMMSAHFIDYKGHQGKITDADRDFKKTELMNDELMGQKETVKKKLQKVARSIEDGYGNLQIYRTHRRKLKHDVKQAKSVTREIDDLYEEIGQADKMLAYMQTQHLKIVRKFINQAKRKSPSEFKHLPRRLAPFLHLIEEDDRLVRNLGEILVPIQMDLLKSDRRSLLVDIITIVNDKIAAEKRKAATIQKSLRTVAVKKQSPRSPPTPPNAILPVVVKVRKSSVSILSSKSLTQESIKKIMETVDNPIQVMKKAYKASAKHKVKLAGKISNNVVDNVSASDIKIIYMPKRKMLEQLSEPCRTVDESESLVAAVPPRKCRSTDAVLMKCRKKRQKGVSSRSKSKVKLVNKRSNSITAIPLSKDVGQNKIVGRNPEIKEKLNTKRDHVRRPPECEPIVHANPDSVINDVSNSKHEKYQDLPIEVEYDFNQNFIHDSKPLTGTLPNEDGDKIGPLVQPAFSVLKLIYDNLEEDRKSAGPCPKARLELESLLDTNRSEMSDRNFTAQMSTIDTPDIGSVHPPRPQFFKVDRRGIVRPESPYKVTFRQPTFLNLTLSYEQQACPLTGCEQHDEENQLGALSPEERLQIASEQESTTARRVFLSGQEKRQVYHGIPACMGVSNAQYNLPDTPDHWKVPYYLRKWQQQLPSRKIVKTTPRKVACNVIRTARIPHANKGDAKHEYFSRTVSSKPQNLSMCLPELGTHLEAVHLPNLPLPPLSMYPVKRPSTAECNRLETLYTGRITEPDSVLRLYTNSPK